MVHAATVAFTMDVTDGIDTVRMDDIPKVIYIRRYDYLSTIDEEAFYQEDMENIGISKMKSDFKEIENELNRSEIVVYSPRDCTLILFTINSDAVAQWSEVCIATDIDCILGASLYARVALPAHVRLNVVGAPMGGINMHDI